MGKKAKELLTTTAALCGFADEVLRATARGESRYAYAVEHLFAMLQQNVGDDHPTPRTSLLYFVANYTMARHARDNTDREATALAELDEAQVREVVDYVRDHPALARVLDAWRRMTGAPWLP